MALVENSIKTLFGGVSRQPDDVRRDNQVEDADNALFSVVTGGFEKRPATQHLGLLSGTTLGTEYSVHIIDRDSTEQYVVLLRDGEILVYDAFDGSQETVNIGDTEHYFVIEGDASSVATILSSEKVAWDSSETQFAWDFSATASTTIDVEGSDTGDFAGEETTLTTLTGTSDTANTTVGDDHTFIRVKVTSAAGSNDSFTLKATFKDLSYLINAFPEEFAFTTVADYTFIVNRTLVTRMAEAQNGSGLAGTVQTFADLPGSPGGGDTYHIVGDDVDEFTGYYVEYDNSAGVWKEEVAPNQHNKFDPSTLPHRLVRESDGTFTYSAADWAERQAGDETLVPEPSFVGSAITDIFFHRSRLGVLADENVYYSQTGKPLDFWPEKAIDVLDTDPIDRSASTQKITLLEWATPFRKLLFLTSATAQFEVSALDTFGPETAVVDLATTYQSSDVARPIVMGDTLYFASFQPRSSVVLEYFFEESTLSNTAADVTKHVIDYVPTEIVQFAADPTTGTVFALSSGDSFSLYVYRTFWDGREKVQSAWSRYKFAEDATEGFIHGMAILSGFLVLIIERPGGISLEQATIETEDPDSDLGYIPLLDQRTISTGSYDSGTDTTTWTLEWQHDDDAVVILSGDFSEPGRKLPVTYPTSTTVAMDGDFSSGQAYIGSPYTMDVELSALFMRDREGVAITTGKTKVKDIWLNFQDSGYIKAEVTPDQRDMSAYEMTGRTLGLSSNEVGAAAIIENEVFKVPVLAENRNVTINIKNDTEFPCTITSARWRGFFNEVSRQEPS